MIFIKKKADSTVPGILKTKGLIATEILKRRFNDGDTTFGSKDFDSTIYGNEKVKEALIEIQDNKCCFCESKIGHISLGDVEHFRPKAGWVQDEEAMNKPGYYWLAYDWDNLLLSCEKCNQRYKKNHFPLIDNTKRALSQNENFLLEQPVFINPASEDAEAFITFNEEIPTAVDGNIRGGETIRKLGLDRELLNEQRREKLNLVKDIYDLARDYPLTYPELKERARQKIKKYYDSSLKDETEYASMLRAFFKHNPL